MTVDETERIAKMRDHSIVFGQICFLPLGMYALLILAYQVWPDAINDNLLLLLPGFIVEAAAMISVLILLSVGYFGWATYVELKNHRTLEGLFWYNFWVVVSLIVPLIAAIFGWRTIL